MKIGVIGLGLIGGSIFKNLSKSNEYEVFGVSQSVKGQNISTDYNYLKKCNLIFVCTPMSAIIETLEKLNKILSAETIVTDVCSLKEFVSNSTYNFKFIPSHPMAGTENSGWDSSFPELFNGAKWVITPIDGIVLPEQDILENVINDMGAEVIIADPKEHDKAAALISHMPMLISQALCKNIKDNKLAQILASTGFKDTTRLALSNTQMADDMVKLNKNNIIDGINLLKENADSLLDGNYKAEAENIKQFRKNLYD